MLSANAKSEIVRKFYAHLSARNAARMLELWSEDAVMEMPYAPPNFMGNVQGAEALKSFWTMVTGDCEILEVNDLCIYPVESSNQVIITYNGYVERAEKYPYKNNYICIIAFNDSGLIERYTEYFNPINVINAFVAT